MKDGLVIKSPKGDITQKVKTVLKGGEGGPYDIVMLTNKAYDMDSAIEAIAPAVGPNTAVVPLLNGMNHLDLLDAKFGAGRVVGGVARIGVALSPEGEILHTSPFAAFSFGERDGKAGPPGAGRARGRDQESRPRWRPARQHRAGPLGQVGVPVHAGGALLPDARHVGRHPGGRGRAGDRARDARGVPQGGGGGRLRSEREGRWASRASR